MPASDWSRSELGAKMGGFGTLLRFDLRGRFTAAAGAPPRRRPSRRSPCLQVWAITALFAAGFATPLAPLPALAQATSFTSPVVDDVRNEYRHQHELPEDVDDFEIEVTLDGDPVTLGSTIFVGGTIRYNSIETPFTAVIGVLFGQPITTGLIEGPANVKLIEKPDYSGFLAALTGDPFAVGSMDNGSFTPYHAFLYDNAAETLTDLGTLQPGNANASSSATGVAADGLVVVGYSSFASDLGNPAFIDMTHAFRWTDPAASGNGMSDLSSAVGPGGYSRAFDLTSDGGTVVGESDFWADISHTSTNRHAFRWTSGGGFEDLGTLSSNASIATAITSTGSAIAGGAGHAFVWTDPASGGSGMTDLGTLSGKSYSIATGISDNGKVVVGDSSTRPLSVTGLGNVDFGTTDTRAFRWTDPGAGGAGMADLTTELANNGTDMTGVVIVAADGISDDGQWITAEATTSQTPINETEGVIIHFCDDFVDACDTGVTTLDSQDQSAADLALARDGALTHLGGTADLLLGSLDPLTGSTSAGASVGLGSFTFGAHGRYDGGDALTLLGGVGFTQQDLGAIGLSALLGAASLRYTWIEPSPFRPFVEIGGWATPVMSLDITRTYANGAATATSTGATSGLGASLYARGGVLWMPNNADEVVLAGTFSRNVVHTDAYTEATGPIPASFAASTAQSNTAQVTVSYSHRFSPTWDATLTASVGRSFAAGGTVTGSIGGTAFAAGSSDYTFVEAGARLSYLLGPNAHVEGFVLATLGQSIGAHTTIGGGAYFSF